MQQNKRTIFKNSSTTYFYSSLFFPKREWSKVATFYAYVRTADDFVDAQPQDIEGFREFIRETIFWLRFYSQTDYLENGFVEKIFDVPNSKYTHIIRPFVELFYLVGIEFKWLVAFLEAMQSDISSSDQKIVYETREQLNHYIFGSAEVIGLCMCKILNLTKSSYHFAQLQGAAMQHINFIRDIAEDCELNRQYLPKESLKQFGLENICNFPSRKNDLKIFNAFIRSEISMYRTTQKAAEKGYKYIPFRYRVPIITAAKLYLWTAEKIYDNPKIIFEKKIKPTKLQVMKTLLLTLFKEIFR